MNGEWPDLVHSALENIDLNKSYLWPVRTMPRLEHWVSTGGKVGVIGGAAHAVSPITGQGVNWAFEDAYMLANVLANKDTTTADAMSFWQDQRMKRVHVMIDRLVGPGTGAQKGSPLETKSRIASQKDEGDARGDAWLSNVNIDKIVSNWVANIP